MFWLVLTASVRTRKEPAVPMNALDSGRPRWEDAAQEGAANASSRESLEPPAVRTGRGWRWAVGSVWAAAGAGTAGGEGPSPGLAKWDQSHRERADPGPLPPGARRIGLRRGPEPRHRIPLG